MSFRHQRCSLCICIHASMYACSHVYGWNRGECVWLGGVCAATQTKRSYVPKILSFRSRNLRMTPLSCRQNGCFSSRYVHVYGYVGRVCVCVCVREVCACLWIRVYLCGRVCVCVCVRVYVHAYTYVYIHVTPCRMRGGFSFMCMCLWICMVILCTVGLLPWRFAVERFCADACIHECMHTYIH